MNSNSIKIEIVAIGDEVLYGYTVNSNASYLSKLLLEAGFLVDRVTVVGDDSKAIQGALLPALSAGNFVIITGGLGPTIDDLTRVVVAGLFNVELEYHPELATLLRKRFGDLPTIENQATLPKTVKILPNELGTASGFILENNKLFPQATLIAFPGVPAELKAMAAKELVAVIREKIQIQERLFIEPFHFMQLTEPMVDPILREIEQNYKGVRCGIYPAYGTLIVHLKAHSSDEATFQKLIEAPKKQLLAHFGNYLFKSATGSLDEALHEFLLTNKITLATAESCTGGALSARFVRYSGASNYFRGSIVSYSNQAKQELLDVDSATLVNYGTVSVEVTQEMAAHAAAKFHAMCAVGISGILGPTGGSVDKPVGTICVSIYLEGHPLHSWTMHLKGNREVIMERAIQGILAELFNYLRKNVAAIKRSDTNYHK